MSGDSMSAQGATGATPVPSDARVEIVQAVIEWSQRRGGRVPHYVIVDTETALRVEFESSFLCGGGSSSGKTFLIIGCEIVAMPTDGIKMIRPVDYPYDEAIREVHPSASEAQK